MQECILVGHSLGGDVVFEALQVVVDYSSGLGIPLKAVMTIDSQLDGVFVSTIFPFPFDGLCGGEGVGINDLITRDLSPNTRSDNATTVQNAHKYGIKVFTLGDQWDTYLAGPLAFHQTADGADDTTLFPRTCIEVPLDGLGCGHVAAIASMGPDDTDAAALMAEDLPKQAPDTIPPGGLWVSPTSDGGPSGDSILVQAEAYDNRAGSGVAYVNFTAYAGPWHGVCPESTPSYDDVYTCNLDLTGAPAGPVTISFDVYDSATPSNVRLAPNGEHTITYAPGSGISPPAGGCPTHNWAGPPYLNVYYDDYLDSQGFCEHGGFYEASSTFGDLALPAGRVYYVDDDMTISGTMSMGAGSLLQVSNPGTTLTVAGTLNLAAGTTVQFTSGVNGELCVYGDRVFVTGTLTASGTASQPVRFLDSTSGAGQWEGIDFWPGSSGSLDHVLVSGGGLGSTGPCRTSLTDHAGNIAWTDLLLDGTNPTITNSTFDSSAPTAWSRGAVASLCCAMTGLGRRLRTTLVARQLSTASVIGGAMVAVQAAPAAGRGWR